MDPNPWTLLLERTLKESTSITLHLYTTAAERVSDPDSLLKRLEVVWIWQLKHKGSPFHEFFVIETVDPEHGNKVRQLILERVLLDGNRTEVSEVRSWYTTRRPPNNINNLFLGRSRESRQPRAIHIHILLSCFDSLSSIVASRYRKFGLS